MLGLGLALSVGRKLLGDAIGRLIQELSIRGTYSENLIDTRNIITDIDDADVLDKATILLTPTATSDARVHSVKTYTGDELLDVSSLSGTNWTADGSGGFTNNGSGEGLNGSLNENTIIGATYKFTFDVTISGIANATFGGVTIPVFTTSGSKEYYVIATSSSTSFSFYLAPSGSPSMFVNNISIVDVSSDFDFDRASSATRINSDGLVQDMQSITDPELVTNGTFDTDSDWVLGTGWNIADGHLNFDTDDGENNAQQQGLLTVGRIYKMTFDANVTTGTIRFESGTGSNLLITSSDTTVEHIFEADLTALVFRRNVTPTRGYIDNISVKDITFSEDVDLARINYDSNGENGHILLEPTSTNLLPYSEDFSQWSSSGSATIESGFVSPDGSNSAYKVSGTVGSTTVYYSGVPNLSRTSTRTIWARTVSGTGTINLCSYGQNTNNNFTITEEWQRFEVNGTTTSTGESNFYAVDFRFEESNPLREVIIWGAQAENLTYATSYIPTLTGSTVTRATETLTGSGNSTLINSTEGVLYVEALMQDTGAFKTAARITATDTSTTDGMWIYFKSDNKIQSVLRVGGVDQTGIQSGVKTTNQYYKVAFKFKQNDFALWIDGIEVATDTSGNTFSANTLSKVGFVLGTDTNPFYGKVKALAVFDEALSDDELENLTS